MSFFVQFFPVFANHSADCVFEFGGVELPFVLFEMLVGVFVLKISFQFHMDVLVTLYDDGTQIFIALGDGEVIIFCECL